MTTYPPHQIPTHIQVICDKLRDDGRVSVNHPRRIILTRDKSVYSIQTHVDGDYQNFDVYLNRCIDLLFDDMSLIITTYKGVEHDKTIYKIDLCNPTSLTQLDAIIDNVVKTTA